jgi:hypothetical protein
MQDVLGVVHKRGIASSRRSDIPKFGSNLRSRIRTKYATKRKQSPKGCACCEVRIRVTKDQRKAVSNLGCPSIAIERGRGEPATAWYRVG